MLAKDAEVQQHVALEPVADEEAEAARGVEPFHTAGDRQHLGRAEGFVDVHVIRVEVTVQPVLQFACVTLPY